MAVSAGGGKHQKKQFVNCNHNTGVSLFIGNKSDSSESSAVMVFDRTTSQNSRFKQDD